MKRLSEKKYWASLYNPEGFNKYSKIRALFSYSLQVYDYYNIIKKHLKKTDKNIIEIGCAPGIFLIKAYNKLGLKPFGVEYTENGKILTENNLKENRIKDFEIYLSDVFDENFQKNKKNTFDVVFSNGFIEHFDDYKKTLDAHINIAKPGGLIVISIPNLLYLNKYLTIQEVNDICNLNVMDLNFLKNNIPNTVKIEKIGYYGGLINLGVFFFRNKFIEFIRKLFFAGQRLIIEPIFIFLSSIGIRFNWKYSSPAIVIVYRKNDK